jgi:hypothetical protein
VLQASDELAEGVHRKEAIAASTLLLVVAAAAVVAAVLQMPLGHLWDCGVECRDQSLAGLEADW